MGSRIRAGALAGPLGALKSRGGDVSRVIPRSGLSGDQLNFPETIIDSDAYLGVLARCMLEADHRTFMVQCGLDMRLEDLGLSGQAVISANTLREALSIAQDVLRYFQSGSKFFISTGRGRCRVHYYQSLGDSEAAAPDVQMTVGLVASLVSKARHSIDPELTLYYPDAESVHLIGLPTSTKFKSSTDGIVEFDERALQSPMPQGNSDRAEILKSFLAANTIDQSFDLSLTATVEQLVRASVGIARVSQPGIAAMMGMSIRTLQRSLRTDGTTYRQVLDGVRQTIAMGALRNGESVTDTAMMLGYDYTGNFSTAFRKWFDRAPTSIDC